MSRLGASSMRRSVSSERPSGERRAVFLPITSFETPESRANSASWKATSSP